MKSAIRVKKSHYRQQQQPQQQQAKNHQQQQLQKYLVQMKNDELADRFSILKCKQKIPKNFYIQKKIKSLSSYIRSLVFHYLN